MDPHKILAQTKRYDEQLAAEGVIPARTDPTRTFGSLSRAELLAHARYLAQGIPAFVDDPGKWGKANRHYTALQMCLSFADRYTLQDLMEHNRPREEGR